MKINNKFSDKNNFKSNTIFVFNNTGKLFSLKKIPNYVKPTPFLNHTALDYCSFYKTVM